MLLPESEGGTPGKQNWFGLGFGFFEQAEKGMILHTNFPKHLATVPASHHKLQSILTVTLLQEQKQNILMFPLKQLNYRANADIRILLQNNQESTYI